MSGYLYFEATGVDVIDKILLSIESAGHAYHHTSDWNDGDVPVTHEIECAAKLAADEISTLKQQLEEVKANLAHTEECCVAWAADVGKLAKQNTELLKDAERLDYLDQKYPETVERLCGDWYWRTGYGKPRHKSNSVREAIDAAIASGGGGEVNEFA